MIENNNNFLPSSLLYGNDGGGGSFGDYGAAAMSAPIQDYFSLDSMGFQGQGGIDGLPQITSLSPSQGLPGLDPNGGGAGGGFFSMDNWGKGDLFGTGGMIGTVGGLATGIGGLVMAGRQNKLNSNLLDFKKNAWLQDNANQTQMTNRDIMIDNRNRAVMHKNGLIGGKTAAELTAEEQLTPAYKNF